MAQFGGARGLRDAGLFDSALARPQHQFHFEGCNDLASLAAAYGFGLARNHPFVDGNKRIAFLAVGIFLAMNGRELHADPLEAIQTIVALAMGKLDEEGFAIWVRHNMESNRGRRR